MKLIHKESGAVVELLENTCKNKYGNIGRWVRCENGHVVGIWENQIGVDFVEVIDDMVHD